MPKPRRPWTVTPHDPLVRHEDNLWSVEGFVPGAPFRRRMTIARRADGTLIFFHAVPLEEKVLTEVQALGRSGRHWRADIPIRARARLADAVG